MDSAYLEGYGNSSERPQQPTNNSTSGARSYPLTKEPEMGNRSGRHGGEHCLAWNKVDIKHYYVL